MLEGLNIPLSEEPVIELYPSGFKAIFKKKDFHKVTNILKGKKNELV